MIMGVTANWIPVDIMKPHVQERVLVVCVNPDNHMDRHVSVATYFGVHQRGYDMWSGRKHVTHWFPLPELPD